MKPYRTSLVRNLVLRNSQAPKPAINGDHVIDAHIVKTGFNANTCRSNFQVKNFLQSGDLFHAHQVFDQMPCKNTISLNVMISGFLKFGNLSKARELFDGMVERTAVSWTILIGGYLQSNQSKEACRLYADMRRGGTEPDYVTLVTLLSGCGELETKNVIVQIHTHVIKLGYEYNLMVCNSLVDAYCKTHCLYLASQLFKQMLNKDTVTFNALMTGYSNEGLSEEAIKLFVELQNTELKPSEFTFAALLCAAVGLDDTSFGQQVHGLVLKVNFVWNVFLGNALLDYYSKHNRVDEARKLFDEMPELDGVSYNVVITGYAWNGQFKESFDIFSQLQFARFDRRQFPFATLLSIAANSLYLKMGQQIHCQVIAVGANFEPVVENALVDMYAKCERYEEAQKIFENIACKSTVPWTAMISAYVQKGRHEEGIKLFNDMRRTGVSADQATFASILRACANLASISLGKQLHSLLIRSGFMSNVYSGSALLDTYAKCGCMTDAIKSFGEMPERNSVSWNALISAYAQNGNVEGTLDSFQLMTQSGYKPDSVSFLSILSACSHCGFVEEALSHFNSMTQIYEVTPKREHYASMVDVLCRSGRFSEAEKLMAQMPFEPDEIMWSSVLNSCRIHKNHEFAKKAADQLFNMEELRDAAPYINMSNIYAVAGQWDNVAKVKKAMRDRGVRKVPAYSWVEIKHQTHVFSANDKSHPQMKNILRKIDALAKQMEKKGYKPDTSCALHDVDEDVKIESLKYHSERLAIAFALLNTPDGSPIVVMKNLRACTDCHAAIKVISKIVGRKLLLEIQVGFIILKMALAPVGTIGDPKNLYMSSLDNCQNNQCTQSILPR